MYICNSCNQILKPINKSVTPMVKGIIYFGLSKSLTKVKIPLSFCFRLRVILHLSLTGT